MEPGRVIASFVVEGYLGGGGMADVYKVRHQVLHSVHALKVLHPERARKKEIRARFLDEGRVQAQLHHPHIVRVTDMVTEAGIAGLVVEYLDGGSLEERLATGVAPLPPRQVRGVVTPLLHALGHAHAKGVVHRDIKPANVLFRGPDYGHPMLSDFGIAKLSEETLISSERTHQTRTGLAMGTPGYMSPEQVKGASEVGPPADLFSMGVIVWELLTGQQPFRGSSDFEVMRRISEGLRPRILEVAPELDDGLAAVVERALARDARKRFQSAEAFARALDEAVERMGDEADRVVRVVPIRGGDTTASEQTWHGQGSDPGDDAPTQVDAAHRGSTALDTMVHAPPRAAPPPASVAAGDRRTLTLLVLAVLVVGGGGVALLGAAAWLAFSSASEEERPRLTPKVAIDSRYAMVRITPPPETLLGSPEDEPGRGGDEGLLTASTPPFLLGAREVTQGLWSRVMGDAPVAEGRHEWTLDGPQFACDVAGVGDALPVVCVSWYDAVRFANRMSNLEGLDPVYEISGTKVTWLEGANGYRLPTEVEWEVAARAGRSAAHGYLGGPDGLCAAANGASRLTAMSFGWLELADPLPCEGPVGLRPVGALAASPSGLSDLFGNAAEWTWDVYYPQGVVSVPPAQTYDVMRVRQASGDRVVRGGSWASGVSGLRAAAREAGRPGGTSALVGLRLARDLPR